MDKELEEVKIRNWVLQLFMTSATDEQLQIRLVKNIIADRKRWLSELLGEDERLSKNSRDLYVIERNDFRAELRKRAGIEQKGAK